MSVLGWHARAAAVLAVTVLAAVALRRAKPRLRHGLLAVGLLSAVALPTLAAVAPVSWAVQVPAQAVTAQSPQVLPELPMAAAPAQPATAIEPIAQPAPLDWGSLLVGVWLLGALLGLGRALVSAIGAWSLRRDAGAPSPALAGIFEATQRELGSTAGLRVSPRIGVPIVVGVVRPTILLPREAEGWDTTRLRAVLLHELGHVVQGDSRLFFAVHLVRSVLWIDPLAWVAARLFFRVAEYAADDAALGGGIEATDYAAELLALARLDLRAVPLVAAPALGRPVISTRIRRLLQDPPTLLRMRRIVPVLLGALGGASAVVLMRPADPQTEPRPEAVSALEQSETVPLPADAPRIDLHAERIEARVGGASLELRANAGLSEAREGHLIRPVLELLETTAANTPLLVRADDAVRFDALVDVLYTGGRAGFVHYLLVVDVSGEERGLPLDPPTFTADDLSTQDEPRSLRVHWIGAGHHLRVDPSEGSGCSVPTRDPQVLRRAAARMCEVNGNRPTPVVFAPDASTSYAELVETIAAAERDCGGNDIIEAGGGSVDAVDDAAACDLDTFGR